ncbi:MAG: alpha/beta hydrolase [Salinigranum sp.]
MTATSARLEEPRRRRPSRFEFSTVKMTFESGGERCVGTLYRPDRPARAPAVVMANGTGAERTFGLPAYAERFAERGYAAFTFDYRTFGDSEGEPRNLVAPERQASDLRAALEGVRNLDGVDTARVALWGFSLGGGHALEVAADDPRVAAVVGLAPMTDGKAVADNYPLGYRARALAAGLRDRVQSLAFDPHTVPVVGPSEEFAVLNQPGVESEFRRLVPPGSGWRNETPARLFLSFRGYRPVADAASVTCPTLLVAGGRDDVVPASVVEDAADAIAEATFVRLPMRHYDPFDGRPLERSLAHQFAFLETYL